jgi:RecB family endonuclease NucS
MSNWLEFVIISKEQHNRKVYILKSIKEDMGKSQQENRHEHYCTQLESALLAKGYAVQREIPLDCGRGSVDVMYTDHEGQQNVVEVKGMPSSPRIKKIQRQFERYKQQFGEGVNYFLGYPQHTGNFVLCDFSTGLKRSLGEL